MSPNFSWQDSLQLREGQRRVSGIYGRPELSVHPSPLGKAAEDHLLWGGTEPIRSHQAMDQPMLGHA